MANNTAEKEGVFVDVSKNTSAKEGRKKYMLHNLIFSQLQTHLNGKAARLKKFEMFYKGLCTKLSFFNLLLYIKK
jgi:hypothetical protein